MQHAQSVKIRIYYVVHFVDYAVNAEIIVFVKVKTGE